MTETRKLRVFLCHASQDKSIVRELYKKLADKNWIDPGLDEEVPLPIHLQWDSFEKEVSASDVVIVFLSNTLTQEEYYLEKVMKANEIAKTKTTNARFIVLLKLDDCSVPLGLMTRQWLDYSIESRERADRLVFSSLETRALFLGIPVEESQIETRTSVSTSTKKIAEIMPKRKLRVFLCHSSQDKPIVRELYHRLNAEGWVDPWLDEEKLLPGQAWDLEIEKAVEASDAVVVCLSNHSTTKEGYIQKELRFVLDIADEKPESTIFVIPLRLESCPLPRRLKMWHYLDFFPSDHQNRAFGRLLDSLKARSESLTMKSPHADIELSIAEIVQDMNEKPNSESEDVLFNKIASALDKEIDFDELWLLCDDVELKMQENSETEHFSLGAFGVGRPKLHLLKDVVTYLHDHKLLHYFIDVIKNKRPGLLKDEILNSLT